VSNPVKAFALVKDGAIVVLSGDEDSVLFDAECCDGGRVVPLVENRGEREELRALLNAIMAYRAMTGRAAFEMEARLRMIEKAIEAAQKALGEQT